MRQIILGKTFGQLGSGPLIYTTLRGNTWSFSTIDAHFLLRHSHPWSVAGTFKHFYMAMQAPTENGAPISWTATTYTLVKIVAGVVVPTALTVTVPAAGPVAQNGFSSAATDSLNEVTVSPGDVLAIERVGGTISGVTNSLSACMEWSLTFDSDNDGESGYGSGAQGSRITGGSGYVCAPLSGDEGAFVLIGSAEAVTSTTSHSIVPLAGNLTRMDIQLEGAPGAGTSYTFCAVINGVVQDGSGGTTDTHLTIADTATSGSATFALPLVPLKWLSVHETAHTGSPASVYATFSCRFTATTNGQSALCYDSAAGHPITNGSTDWACAYNSGWAWTTSASPTPIAAWRSARWPTTETLVSLSGSPDPFTLKGFCVNLSVDPGTGNSYNFVTREAFADAAPKLTMTGASGTDSVLFTDPDNGEADFTVTTDRLNIQTIGVSSPVAASVGWSWLMVTDTEPPPPPPVVVTYQPRWLRRFALPFNQNKWSFISRFELILQAGVGLSGTSTTQGYDPIVMFRLSRDGGQTWDTELQMSMGKLGEYDYRAFLNRLGRARNPVVELTGSDPVFVTLLDAVVDIEEGTS